MDFALLGHWTCGTYVERFDTFATSASAAWEDKSLCSYGAGPSNVVEIMITNDDTANPRDAGVRTNGSGLNRRVTLAAAVGGGVAPVTMLAKTDNTGSAAVELYAQDNTDVDFYLAGYWSVSPRAYTELFADAGSPSSSATWQDKDLTGSGVPDNAVAEFVLLNRDTAGPYNMGARANGSALGRLLNLHKAALGGGNAGRMQVAADSTATVELYHGDITKAHSFYLTGYWTSCDTSIAYVVTDLGAVTSSKSSVGWHINSSERVAGFEEDSSGNPTAWFSSCGSFTSLGTLGGSYAESHGINDADMLVGWSHNGSGKRRAFRWTSGGGMVDLGTVSGRADSEALSVNASSEIVGTVMDFASYTTNRLAFLYLPSAAYGLGAGMNSLGTLGGTQSVAMDINASGRVVGGAQNASGYFRPFRWNSGTMTDLGTLGGDSVLPDHRGEAVNSSGNICGRSYNSSGDARAFYWNGSMTDLGVLTGGTESWAFGINDSNVVVGTSEASGGVYRAFVWDSANGLRNLNSLIPSGSGWTLIRATDINNEGFITGWGTNGSGETRAFLLSPSCNAGGAGAVAASFALASGSGMTDASGAFDGSAVDADGAELARIEVLEADPQVAIAYQVLGAPAATAPVVDSGAATAEGFVDGVAVPRTLKVETSAPPGGLALTVSLSVTPHELAMLGAAAPELELHVFAADADETGPAWVPAGRGVGESLPRGIVGESGYWVYGDGVVEYWAVRDGGGLFAVGKGVARVEEDEPRAARPQRLCGFAMIQPLVFCVVVLLFVRRSRRASGPHDKRERSGSDSG
ncbi:MAG: hypothetical protein HY763_16690 [Planctomycetes bacterium]|nr:hypothetical protein [Planctomycetota bacterium]